MYYKELSIIQDYYGSKRAARSNVLMINHIHEGLAVLESIYATEYAKRAFCLHPIIQNEITEVGIKDVSNSVIILCKEYKEKANSYLCKPETDWVSTPADVQTVVGYMTDDCVQMLFADKVQNRKDFNLYHKKTHPRSKQLSKYFDLWILYLKIQLDKDNLL